MHLFRSTCKLTVHEQQIKKRQDGAEGLHDGAQELWGTTSNAQVMSRWWRRRGNSRESISKLPSQSLNVSAVRPGLIDLLISLIMRVQRAYLPFTSCAQQPNALFTYTVRRVVI